MGLHLHTLSKFYICVKPTDHQGAALEGVSSVPVESGLLKCTLILCTELALKGILRSSCLSWMSCFLSLILGSLTTTGGGAWTAGEKQQLRWVPGNHTYRQGQSPFDNDLFALVAKTNKPQTSTRPSALCVRMPPLPLSCACAVYSVWRTEWPWPLTS